MDKMIYIGTDGGATTSKVGGVWSDGSTISTKLLQSSTNSAHGPEAVVRSWGEAISKYLAQHDLTWEQVGGVGLAVPGPFQRYGVFDRSANLPENFAGFDVHSAYSNAIAERAGRAIPLTVGNDGDMGGAAEAQLRAVTVTGRCLCWLPAPGWDVPTSIRTDWLWMAIPLLGWKAVTCPRLCICWELSNIPVGVDAPGAVSKSIPAFQACNICWLKNWSNIPNMIWQSQLSA